MRSAGDRPVMRPMTSACPTGRSNRGLHARSRSHRAHRRQPGPPGAAPEGADPSGCWVLEAADGREGVRLFRESHPDLVLLDIIMPEKDGDRDTAGTLDLDDRVITLSVTGWSGAAQQDGTLGGFGKPSRPVGLLFAVRMDPEGLCVLEHTNPETPCVTSSLSRHIPW